MLPAIVFMILYLPLGVIFSLTKKYRESQRRRNFDVPSYWFCLVHG